MRAQIGDHVCWNPSFGGCIENMNQPDHSNLMFKELCNGIVETTSDIGYHTDESDCNMTEWTCLTHHNTCSNVWNCLNEQDELNCNKKILALNNCPRSKQFCFNASTGNGICLPLQRTADNIIHCVDSSDERQFCRTKYPNEYARRYRCRNSDMCILVNEICDCHQNCPENDDETTTCKWINNGRQPLCDPTQFRCQNGKLVKRVGRYIADMGKTVCTDSSHRIFCNHIDDIPFTNTSAVSDEIYTSVMKSQILFFGTVIMVFMSAPQTILLAFIAFASQNTMVIIVSFNENDSHSYFNFKWRVASKISH
ncbi:unnamed protein product [Rotaria magnacalcarata]|uniref:Uncharacterized protein n=1 Tax=Rotaria magnacalcarata TaxID=392030 RepID=A0A816UNU6_9BILA|nr:unnamed protein product [Rotaria magnacalcarata]